MGHGMLRPRFIAKRSGCRKKQVQSPTSVPVRKRPAMLCVIPLHNRCIRPALAHSALAFIDARANGSQTCLYTRACVETGTRIAIRADRPTEAGWLAAPWNQREAGGAPRPHPMKCTIDRRTLRESDGCTRHGAGGPHVAGCPNQQRPDAGPGIPRVRVAAPRRGSDFRARYRSSPCASRCACRLDRRSRSSNPCRAGRRQPTSVPSV